MKVVVFGAVGVVRVCPHEPVGAHDGALGEPRRSNCAREAQPLNEPIFAADADRRGTTAAGGSSGRGLAQVSMADVRGRRMFSRGDRLRGQNGQDGLTGARVIFRDAGSPGTNAAAASTIRSRWAVVVGCGQGTGGTRPRRSAWRQLGRCSGRDGEAERVDGVGGPPRRTAIGGG